MYLKFLLQLVEQVEGVATLTVHLVDKDDNRRVAHAAHLHQLACLGLHTFGRVDHDNGRVYGCKRAVGIFGKVLVTRGIKDIYLVVLIVKLHDRCRDRDSSLLLYIHPV